jgi:acyl-coenzyme A synthetase/AMP-(fatty) acid ligase
MILDSSGNATGARATLDDLFRRAGVRHPDAVALADPPNRAAFTDGAPRRLTYAQADRTIGAIAARLHELGLATDAVVALQLPNTVESVLALLGILRAGMIAAPLPLLWHRQDAADALSRIGAKAILTCVRVGATAQAEIAMQVAAELFPIRHVCAFGENLPDGVVALDDVFATSSGATGVIPRSSDPAAHVAVVTFEVGASGTVPLARDHRQLIAGGVAPHREVGLTPDGTILSTIPIGSFAGMAATLLPWLLGGGTLHLHHAFDADAFAQQCREQNPGVIVLPGAAVGRIAEAGLLDSAKTVAALWRAPERLAEAALWHGRAALVDIVSFGEIGLMAAQRQADGAAAPLGYGEIDTRDAVTNVPDIETARSPAGTLCLRGAMVPSHAFPPGAAAPLALDSEGFLDTGHPCRVAEHGRALIVSGPPAGMAAVGAYRFRAGDLDRLAQSLDTGVTLATLPQDLTGEGLAGHATDRDAVKRRLAQQGVNPLIVGAFRQPPEADAA